MQPNFRSNKKKIQDMKKKRREEKNKKRLNKRSENNLPEVQPEISQNG